MKFVISFLIVIASGNVFAQNIQFTDTTIAVFVETKKDTFDLKYLQQCKCIHIVGDTMKAIAFLIMQLNNKEQALKAADVVATNIIEKYKFDAETRKNLFKYATLRDKRE